MKASTTAFLALLAVAGLMVASATAYGVHADDPTVDIPEGVGLCTAEDAACYVPLTITVNAGTTVTWTNNDASTPLHTITSGEIGKRDTVGLLFDSQFIATGDSFEHTFDEAGTYPYFCQLHPRMTGTVIVEAAHYDDHGDGDGMMMMDDNTMMMMTTGDGEVMVHIATSSELTEGEPLELELLFTDAEGQPVQHTNFDYLATQGNTRVASGDGEHSHDGTSSITTRSLQTGDAVDVRVTIQGIGLPGTALSERTGPIGEMVDLQKVPEFGEPSNPITITVNKKSYSAGETVTVNGEVRQLNQGAVFLEVLAPGGNSRVLIDQLTVGDGGAFSTTFVAGGPHWLASGQYEIKVTYGIAANVVTAATLIEYTGGVATPAPAPEPPEDGPLEGITSSITGGTIESISIGSDEASVIAIIDAIDDGELTLTIPRDIFESKIDGQSGDDVPFISLVDSAEADTAETPAANTRTLVIPFTAGSEVVEIFGSWIISESAQPNNPITITTSKKSYSTGETVTVSGKMRQYDHGSATLQVLGPNGQRVLVNQFAVDDTGSFSVAFVAGTSSWSTTGPYEITVTDVGGNRAATTIEFTGNNIRERSVPIPPPAPAPEPPVDDSPDGFTVVIPAGTGLCTEVNGECYSPKSIAVRPGTTVTWTNNDAATPLHTVTSGTISDRANVGSLFGSQFIATGDSFEHTFDQEGIYPYFCQLHPRQSGVVIVDANAELGHSGDKEKPGTTTPTPEPNVKPAPITQVPEPKGIDPLAGTKSSITGGSITSINTDPSGSSLVIVIEPAEGEEITLKIPRDVFVSITGDQTTVDDNYKAIPLPDLKSRFAQFMNEGSDPQIYVDRYNNEPAYKAWFDTYFAGLTIEDATGLK